MNFLYKLLFLAAIMFGASFSARAQACGYAAITIYVQDAEGRAVKDAALKFVDAVNGVDKYYQLTTRTYWDAKREAYVSVHGMCGGHPSAGLKVTAVGFADAERKVGLRLGSQGYLLKLKRRGTDEKVSLEKLSCEAEGECATVAETSPTQTGVRPT
ncbi:MAG TPA: hypothetical protein VF527_04525 [Pyrinomonadaceae bacterium]|jgi:hypothetical protein